MTLGDVTLYALHNLRRHALRTVLTATGVAVGVATLTVLVSLGTGLERRVNQELNRTELVTRINVMPKGFKSRMVRGIRNPGDGDAAVLNDDDLAVLDGLPGVRAAFPALQVQLTVESSRLVAPGVALEGFPAKALGPSFQEALLAGSYWTEDQQGSVVVLPSDVLPELGFDDPDDVIGSTVAVSRLDSIWRYKRTPIEDPRVTGEATGPPAKQQAFVIERPDGLEVEELEVIGVYDTEAFGLLGQRAHAPLAVATDLIDRFGFAAMKNEPGTYQVLIVKLDAAEQVASVIEAIEGEGYDTVSVFDYMQFVRIVFAVFQVVLGFFGGIGLLVAFFGIANTMIMAVLERTREIGVIKALGGRNRDVRRMIFFESAMIGCLGGILGVGCGWLMGLALDAVGSSLLASKLGGAPLDVFYVPGWLALGAVAISTFVAAVAGIYPAWRAARLDPVISLRNE